MVLYLDSNAILRGAGKLSLSRQHEGGMAKVFLIISKPQQDVAQLRVKCTVREGAEDVNVRDRQFAGPRELESALRIAGVTEDESHAPLQVFHTGLPTFIPVNEDIAKKLGVLE